MATTGDLAFEKDDVGTRFITLVVFMMTALATLASGGAQVVMALRASWVDAVSGQITIEIPAIDSKGVIRNADVLAQKGAAIREALIKREDVTSVHVLDRSEVENLVKPWLGEGADNTDLPLPALLGVTLSSDGADTIKAVDAAVKAADADASTETHQTWLADLRRFSLVLLLAAAAMAAAVIACCILTVAGAVKARLAAHHSDIDLLHVMGATDNYIGQQFVRSVVTSVGGAAIAGTALGVVFLKIGGIVAGGMQTAMLPAFHWNFMALVWFAALPAFVTLMCFMGARVTVLRSLRKMP